MDGERSVAAGQVGIGEAAGELSGLEVAVVDLDGVAGAEVGHEEVARGRGVQEREAGV